MTGSFKPQNQLQQNHPQAGQPAPTPPAAHSTESCGACVSEYISVLGQQRALLGELDALSQRQSLLIDEPVLDALLAVLEERQQVVDRIMQTARMVDQIRPHWERLQAQVPEHHRLQVQRESDTVAQLAAEVQRRDEQDHSRLKQRLDGVTSELAGLSTTKKAANAYTPAEQNLPRFQDRNG